MLKTLNRTGGIEKMCKHLKNGKGWDYLPYWYCEKYAIEVRPCDCHSGTNCPDYKNE